jgi:hypothetical protein
MINPFNEFGIDMLVMLCYRAIGTFLRVINVMRIENFFGRRSKKSENKVSQVTQDSLDDVSFIFYYSPFVIRTTAGR